MAKRGNFFKIKKGIILGQFLNLYDTFSMTIY